MEENPFDPLKREPRREDEIVTSIAEVPVTVERPLAAHTREHLYNPGLARATVAATVDMPLGTEGAPQDRTVLQQHVDFFDRNNDGVITMMETFQGQQIHGDSLELILRLPSSGLQLAHLAHGDPRDSSGIFVRYLGSSLVLAH